ncbi:outer membrane protein transport protein [Acidiphilium sp. AL]|uniref:Outer membrane protein transport protein n=1 Tax=Acidiphilium iwatense TaxID=768198 RepID=A0ABS9DW24_9PROT|nr:MULTISPECIES: outer membrane protein transport protein [Acidiphilium]MCF3946338.1 outer membrane protein transport protein [Acidiphilium iwatense]MCU4159878.1 outer membrane protein transport protein [Acidiphilium sp. AL]
MGFRIKRTAIAFAAGTALATSMGAAHAAGLGLIAQSTGALAHAFGGVTVNATPSTAYYNPAGMVLISGNQFEGDLNYYDINSSFTGSSTVLGSGTGKNFVESTLVPGNFGVISLPHGVKLGFSITTPIGGRIKYAPDFVGQFQGNEALITSVQIGLDVAIPITRKLSIGFGPEINYFQNILGLNQNLAPFPAAEGQFKGQSYAFGYNIGAMYQFSPSTRIGIDYRSKIGQTVKGPESVHLDPSLYNLLSAFNAAPPIASNAFDRWTFPQQISFGIYQQVTPRLSLMASAQWTNWAQQQALVITDPSTIGFTLGSIYTPFKYRNTWTVGLGANYVAAPGLTLMGGVGYDESPVTAATRQDLLPDANRVLLGAGLTYQIMPMATLQLGYQHIFVASAPINQTRSGLNADNSLNTAGAAGTLTGTYNLSANVFSTGVILKF